MYTCAGVYRIYYAFHAQYANVRARNLLNLSDVQANHNFINNFERPILLNARKLANGRVQFCALDISTVEEMLVFCR